MTSSRQDYPQTITTANTTLLIVGAGGMGIEALWVAREMNRIGRSNWDTIFFADDAPELFNSVIEGVKVIGSSTIGLSLTPCFFHCGIGNNQVREKIASAYEARGFKPATLIHPSAVIAESAIIGEGTYIGANSVVMPLAKIGKHVIINILATASHHSVIGDFAQVCPGAKINGHCHLGSHAFIGSNVSLQPGTKVGEHACVGANSFVNKDVEPSITVHGNPAKPFFKKNIKTPLSHD